MKFDSYPELYFGIEEEFFILNQQYNLVPGIGEIIEKIPRSLFSNKIIYHEFHQSQIEINSGVCSSYDEAKQDLEYLRGLVNDIAKNKNMKLVGIGTHPAADWKKGTINPRYSRNLSRRKQFQAYLTCGIHIHISMSKALRALKVMNALKYLVPPIIALSANSPFENKKFSGFIDYRLKMLEKAHTLNNKVYAGIPPYLKDIKDWEKLRSSVDIPVYYDIRPNAKYGTVEIRVCDSQPRISDSLALASLIRILAGEILKNKIGIKFVDEKKLKEIREDSIKKGLRSQYVSKPVINYLSEELMPSVLDSLKEYSLSEKEIKPITDIIKNKKNLADEQIEIYKKTKSFDKITQEFSSRFLK